MPRAEKDFASRNQIVKVCIPVDVLTAIDAHIMDYSRNRPHYGARSRLVTALLKRWIDDPSLVPLTLVDAE